MAKSIYDAVIIFGGGREKDSGLLTKLSIARLDSAIEIIKGDQAGFAVVMGGRYKSYTPEMGLFDTNGADLRKEYLVKHGIPSEKIITIGDECRDTVYEALASRRIIESRNWKNICISTSINHIPRTLYITRKVYSGDMKIDPLTNPPTDMLNSDQERILLNLTHMFLLSFNGRVPDPISWDFWYKEHKSFYEHQRIIHEMFRDIGVESQDAYASIHPKER